jgi:hypothetical protein
MYELQAGCGRGLGVVEGDGLDDGDAPGVGAADGEGVGLAPDTADWDSLQPTMER